MGLFERRASVRPIAGFIDGISPSTEIRFLFEGEVVVGHEGEAIASALLRHGRTELRRTGSGQPRSYYCGMGICWDCAVHVESVGVVRACAFAVRPGLVVFRADGATP